MSLRLLKRRIKRHTSDFPLQSLLTVPFLLQIFITVGLVGFFSFHNGQQTVNEVTTKLRDEVTFSVQQHLHNYLATPQLIVELNQKAAKLDQFTPNNLKEIELDFWQQIQIFDSVDAIYFANQAGQFAYLKKEARDTFVAKPVEVIPQRRKYLLDKTGKRTKFLGSEYYDPLIRPWYIKTTETHRNNWSNIYTFAGGELGITAGGELYDRSGNFRGVVGVDLVLSRISNFLEQIEISENGQIFIIERNGNLVATSTGEKPFVYNAANNTEERLQATNSDNIFTQATFNYLTQYFGSLHSIKKSRQLEFKFDGDRHLVQVLPYQDELGVDWLIVVVVPEADFMAKINANIRNTILLCLGALILTAIFGVITSRKIIRPISHLIQVSSIIAHSAGSRSTRTDFYPIVKADKIRELNILATAFNDMAIQLKAAFKDLETTNEELENRVQQRTAALREAKEAADAANRAKSQFLAHMSHELRTPLHAILGFTQVSLQDASLKPQQIDNLNTVKRSGEHLLALINDVLEMSKIEAGTIEICEQPFDLHLLLNNLATMFQLRSQAKNINLIFSLTNDVPRYIQTDEVKMRQILINLIENGIKFTTRGRVSLQVSSILKNKLAATLQFTVKDTGCGIPASELNSIFEAFVQTKQISNHEGTGLGLAIAQQFARLLGGDITVSSIVGKGSIFRLEFPVTLVEQSELSSTSTLAEPKCDRPQEYYKSLPQSPPNKIDPSSLATMPHQWIEQLHQAAIELDGDAIALLLQQIPSSNAALAEGLSQMLEQFEYDEIITLSETVISKE
jgi:signal transduction histidine kinase